MGLTAAVVVEAGGLTGFVLEVVRAVGVLGVGLLVLAEVVVPPVPSEVVLPFSGALVAGGRFTFVGVLAASTIGAVLGAVVLYEASRAAGRARVTRWLAAIPLVERDDVERGADWFERHGGTAVLTGRLVPGVRSLISVPAGAQSMPRGRFLLLTMLGTMAWNALLIGAGMLLGSNWRTVEGYTRWLDLAMVAALLYVIARLLLRRLRAAGDEPEAA